MRTIQITIPKPCHEDWNKMSVQEKGRFCDKCCKTVHDFSSNSPEELKKFIIEHEHEKVCGRFRNDQLNSPIRINIPYHTLGKQMNASQIFLWSLLFVFGTTLFSCTSHRNVKIDEFVLTEIDSSGQLVNEDSFDQSNTTSPSENDTIEYPILGEVSIEPVNDSGQMKKIRKTESIKIDEESSLLDTIINLREVQISENRIPLISMGHSTGLMSIEYSKTEVKSDQDTVLSENKVDKVIDVKPDDDILVYPNPTSKFINLKFPIKSETEVQAQLFDMTGKLIRTLIPNERMQAGDGEYQFNVGDLPPATYFIHFIRGNESGMKRIVKL